MTADKHPQQKAYYKLRSEGNKKTNEAAPPQKETEKPTTDATEKEKENIIDLDEHFFTIKIKRHAYLGQAAITLHICDVTKKIQA